MKISFILVASIYFVLQNNNKYNKSNITTPFRNFAFRVKLLCCFFLFTKSKVRIDWITIIILCRRFSSFNLQITHYSFNTQSTNNSYCSVPVFSVSRIFVLLPKIDDVSNSTFFVLCVSRKIFFKDKKVFYELVFHT